MTAAALVGVLVAAGVFLLLRRGRLPLVLGFVLLGHAVNVVLLSAGGLSRRAPAFDGADPGAADPLPQAFALTAIVITFGITLLLLGLLRGGPPGAEDGDDARPGRTAGTGGPDGGFG